VPPITTPEQWIFSFTFFETPPIRRTNLKHHHDAEVNVNLAIDIPAYELEQVIDKVTDSAVKIIAVFTIAQIAKAVLTR